jgi:hypothetical protein
MGSSTLSAKTFFQQNFNLKWTRIQGGMDLGCCKEGFVGPPLENVMLMEHSRDQVFYFSSFTSIPKPLLSTHWLTSRKFYCLLYYTSWLSNSLLPMNHQQGAAWSSSFFITVVITSKSWYVFWLFPLKFQIRIPYMFSNIIKNAKLVL